MRRREDHRSHSQVEMVVHTAYMRKRPYLSDVYTRWGTGSGPQKQTKGREVVRLRGSDSDKGEEGVQKSENLADII